nr:NnrS family protein [Acanthopleuribacter pedis]
MVFGAGEVVVNLTNTPVLGLAFRPFFLLGGAFSALSILVWSLHIGGRLAFEPFGGSYWWHVHEMLFGFVSAVVVGFLLTAVQTWTKVRGVHGAALLGLVLLWLAARFLLAFPQAAPSWLIPWVDGLFLPCAALLFARSIVKAKNRRNAVFIPILLLMAVANGMMYGSRWLGASPSMREGAHAMVLLVTLVMCLIGGRVFPMFTANGTGTPRVQPIPWLEKVSLGSVGIVVVLGSGVLPVPGAVVGSFFVLAALANALRAFRWRFWVTLGTPLVWALHLSYWAICLGLLLLGCHHWGFAIRQSIATHALTVGGMGGMILAMIARVSLGHTGRPLVVGPVMTAAFGLMAVSFGARVLGPFLGLPYAALMMGVGFAWTAAYTLFVIVYFPILTQPRIDGKPG